MSEELRLNRFRDDVLPVCVQDRSYIRCLAVREELYRLQPELYRVVSNEFNNNWREVAVYNQRISPDGLGVHPSSLLVIIANAYSAGHFNNSIFWKADRVKTIRNRCYGHLPELRITDSLIASLRITRPRVTTFVALLDEIVKLFETLQQY